jgi:lantibiotic modifying enzyme
LAGCIRVDLTTLDEGLGERPVTAAEHRIREAVDRCADALVESATWDRGLAGWLSWDLTASNGRHALRGGNPSLYDGDAGTAWACAHLARVLDRADLADLARAGATHAIARVQTVRTAGLLAGHSGVRAAAHAISELIAETVPGLCELHDAPTDAAVGFDVTDGLAGLVLAAVRCNAPPEALNAVRLLAAGARPEPLGCSWVGPEIVGEPLSGRALCGVAHGNSGIAWALAEAAWACPEIAAPALTLCGQALRWEAAWFDPMRSAWPDLRTDPPGYPALWCHGAAGIGAVRLRLLQLQRAGLDLPVPAATLQAHAEAALQSCAQALTMALQRGQQYGPSGLPHGLTLCHGLGAAIDLMLLAFEVLGSPDHLAAAQFFADEVLAILGEDAWRWPSGHEAGDSTGLFLGLAGTAMVLARAGYPDELIPAPSLLPVGDLPPTL